MWMNNIIAFGKNTAKKKKKTTNRKQNHDKNYASITWSCFICHNIRGNVSNKRADCLTARKSTLPVNVNIRIHLLLRYFVKLPSCTRVLVFIDLYICIYVAHVIVQHNFPVFFPYQVLFIPMNWNACRIMNVFLCRRLSLVAIDGWVKRYQWQNSNKLNISVLSISNH